MIKTEIIGGLVDTSPSSPQENTLKQSELPPVCQKTILVVENNPDEEELIILALQKSQIKINWIVIEDGKEALDYLFGTKKSPEPQIATIPDLILLDLKLPTIDGLEILCQLRGHQTTQSLPVVILTVSKRPEDRTNCYQHGCNSYVNKPVDFLQFQNLVQQLLSYWLKCHNNTAQVKFYEPSPKNTDC